MAKRGTKAPVVPDPSEFKRAEFAGLNASQLVTLISYVEGEIGAATRPERVPWSVIEAMGWDPEVHLGETAATAPVCDSELFFVRHDDPVIVAEVEEWLWALFARGLLQIVARSFAYGMVPYVFTWTVDDLQVTVKRQGKKPRNQVLRDHQHFAKVADVWPGDVELVTDQDDLVAIKHGGKRYETDRAFATIYDRAWGSWIGRGSRRRAYRAWFKASMIDLWQCRWLERSVDPPRIGYAPKGTVKVDGRDMPTTDLLAAALMALKNGGATVLPSEVVGERGNTRAWGVDLLQLPDRSEVWHKALNRYGAEKVLAAMVPPSAVGMEDAPFAAARVPAELFIDFVQKLAVFVASELTRIVEVPHRVRYGRSVKPPEVCARALPKAMRKTLLEVFKTVQGATRYLEDGKVVTLGEQISDEVIDMLGLPKRSTAEAAHPPASPESIAEAFVTPEGGQPGRKRDTTSDREERRENARSEEGEDDTGGPRSSLRRRPARAKAATRGGR
ncbi:MAG: hypothetical protein M9894_17135 [Planctomycetes bacterium]|nr:hypothetical protein [Planctomycetota bacterium]